MRVFLMTRPFTWYYIFYLVTLTLKFDLLLKTFNLESYLVVIVSSDNPYYGTERKITYKGLLKKRVGDVFLRK